MSEKQDENPVVSGLVALATVAVVVGILAGIGAIVATKVVGLGDAKEAAAESTGVADSLVMPDPVPTKAGDGPLVTLAPSDTESVQTDSPDDVETTESEAPKKEKKRPAITLSQGSFEVAPGEKLYLSGIYPGGEGAVLDIEYRIDGGPWDDFPIDASVSGETFSTYVETYKTGAFEWRMVDASAKKVSNVVKVRHG